MTEARVSKGERGGESREERGMGWSRTFWASGRTWAFVLRKRENPGELWAEEGWDLSQMFTGALCWLLRENCQGMGKGRT